MTAASRQIVTSGAGRGRHWARRGERLALAACLLLGLGLRATGHDHLSGDVRAFVLPWLEHFLNHGAWHGLATPLGNYNPPYLYLLALGSLAVPRVAPLIIIKGISVAFDVALALVASRIVRRLRPTGAAASVAFAITFLCPTVILNSAYWGQCDAIFTTFLLLAVLFAMGSRFNLSAGAFAVALSFKLQAIFLLPLYLVALRRRLVGWQAIAAGALTYGLMMLPAWLAGRQPEELASLYLKQADYYLDLTLNAPTLFAFVAHDAAATRLSQLGTGLGGAFLALFIRRQIASRGPLTPAEVLTVAVAAAVALPYVLPRMHERYFFLADILTLILACSRPRLWPLAAIVVLASTWTYMPFLFGKTLPPWALPALALAMGGVATVLLAEALPPPKVASTTLDARADSAMTLLIAAALILLSKANPWWPVQMAGQDITGSDQGFGHLSDGLSVDGGPLRLAGLDHDRGLGSHAPARMVLAVPTGGKHTFSGTCGVDDETAGRGSLHCAVAAGGRVLASSPLLVGSGTPWYFLVDISGYQAIELLLDDGGDGMHFDHGDWVNLRFD